MGINNTCSQWKCTGCFCDIISKTGGNCNSLWRNNALKSFFRRFSRFKQNCKLWTCNSEHFIFFIKDCCKLIGSKLNQCVSKLNAINIICMLKIFQLNTCNCKGFSCFDMFGNFFYITSAVSLSGNIIWKVTDGKLFIEAVNCQKGNQRNDIGNHSRHGNNGMHHNHSKKQVCCCQKVYYKCNFKSGFIIN